LIPLVPLLKKPRCAVLVRCWERLHFAFRFVRGTSEEFSARNNEEGDRYAEVSARLLICDCILCVQRLSEVKPVNALNQGRGKEGLSLGEEACFSSKNDRQLPLGRKREQLRWEGGFCVYCGHAFYSAL